MDHEGNVTINHGNWTEGGIFIGKGPEPQPKVEITISLLHGKHTVLGKKWPISQPQPSSVVSVVADSGAQTCTSGPEILSILGCPESYLLKTRHPINGITGNSLAMMGALLLNIKSGSRTAKVIMYVCRNVSGIFLSQTALKQLAILPSDFPTVSSQCDASITQHHTKCGCPARTETPDLPEKIPYEGIETNLKALQEWILEHFGSSAFNTCPHQPLQEIKGEKMGITFKRDAVPSAVHSPIPIPHHFRKPVKEGLDTDVALGVIEPVPINFRVGWCSRMVVTPKKDGTPRSTVDLQRLNDATLRETHHTPSPFNQVSVVPPHTKKTVLDAWNGYHSVPLSDDARDATTFITDWGRYRYLRAPQGFHASGDGYTYRYDKIATGTPRYTRCIDDTLLWDNNIEEAFWHTIRYIKQCADNGIVFNPDKFVFAQDELEFAGFLVTSEGYRPPKRIIDAILQFPTPSNITGIRSWFGLINQVSYAFAQAPVMAPFRELLASKTRKFYWDSTLDDIFQKSKQHIINEIIDGVKSFEIHRPTCVSTDWSRTGIGFFLWQKHCNCPVNDNPHCGNGHWKVVYAGSRFTTPAESRYAPIEGEALAAVYGLVSCRMFVMGCPNLILAVDHKPLLRILNNRSLEQITNPRLLDFKERTLMYDFKIIYVPGNIHAAPDAASRYPHTMPDSDDVTPATCASIAWLSETAAVTWQTVKEAATSDEECVTLTNIIRQGFPPTRNELPDTVKVYWPMRDSLYVVGGVPFKDHKMLIPKVLRSRLLEYLHEGHQGINAMRDNAKQRFFWPGLGSQLSQVKDQCRRCIEIAPSLGKEPLADPPQPEFPFEQVVVDFFSLQGYDFIIYADRYTGWVEVARMDNKTAKSSCNVFRNWFVSYGVPEELASDGGPPFDSFELRTFLESWGVRQRLSSAYYPQSNGRAELAVKSTKRLLSTNIGSGGQLNIDSAARALLLHRNTPVQDIGLSPAEMLFGHPLKDHLPATPNRMRIEWSHIADAREEALGKRHIRSQERYDVHSSPLPPLSIGDHVAVQNQHGNSPRRWQRTGVIVNSNLPARQYEVKVDGSRRVTRRNRRFIRKIDPICRSPIYSDTPPPYSQMSPGRSQPCPVSPSPPVLNDGPHPQSQPSQQQPSTALEPPVVDPTSTLESSSDTPMRPSNTEPRRLTFEDDLAQQSTLHPVHPQLSDKSLPAPTDQVSLLPSRRGTRARKPPNRYSP